MAIVKGIIFTALCFAQSPVPDPGPTKINGVVYESKSGPHIVTGQVGFQVKRIFVFPSIDDMNGAIASNLDKKLDQLFSNNTRFDTVRDQQVLRALTASEPASYAKAAQNKVVHREAAKVTGSDSTVLLSSKNIGRETEMSLEVRDAEGEPLFIEVSSIPSLSSMDARGKVVEKLFLAFLSKIPFDGSVTGRSASTITLDLGSGGILMGEEVDLVRLVSVQRHPLLKTVVGSDYVRVGKARVNHVDRALSFAEIMDEYSGQSIQPGTKVLRTRSVISVPEASQGQRENLRNRNGGFEKSPFDGRLEGEFDRPKARYGYLGANLLYGSTSYSQSTAVSSEYSGSGLGALVDGELWVTKHWIASAEYSFVGTNMSGGGATLGDAKWTQIRFSGGFRFFANDMGEGAHFTGKLGYSSTDFNIPASSTSSVSGKKFTGPMVGLDGEMMFHRNHKIVGGFALVPFASMTDLGVTPGSPDGATLVSIDLAWHYQLGEMFWSRVGILYDTAAGNYVGGISNSSSRFAIGPGLSYLF